MAGAGAALGGLAPRMRPLMAGAGAALGAGIGSTALAGQVLLGLDKQEASPSASVG